MVLVLQRESEKNEVISACKRRSHRFRASYLFESNLSIEERLPPQIVRLRKLDANEGKGIEIRHQSTVQQWIDGELCIYKNRKYEFVKK